MTQSVLSTQIHTYRQDFKSYINEYATLQIIRSQRSVHLRLGLIIFFNNPD